MLIDHVNVYLSNANNYDSYTVEAKIDTRDDYRELLKVPIYDLVKKLLIIRPGEIILDQEHYNQMIARSEDPSNITNLYFHVIYRGRILYVDAYIYKDGSVVVEDRNETMCGRFCIPGYGACDSYTLEDTINRVLLAANLDEHIDFRVPRLTQIS